MSIGSTGEDGVSRYKQAQSTRSKALKFKTKLCEECNTARTQPGDLAFDSLRERVELIVGEKGELTEEDTEATIPQDETERTNLFRYFSKVLACQIADFGGPVMTEIADFAIGKSDFNPINFQVKLDSTYKAMRAEIGDHQYAAHGGLVITGTRWLGWPSEFFSSVTVGPVQYCFHARLNFVGQMTLLSEFPDFWNWCVRTIAEFRKNPMTELEKSRLGLSS